MGCQFWLPDFCLIKIHLSFVRMIGTPWKFTMEPENEPKRRFLFESINFKVHVNLSCIAHFTNQVHFPVFHHQREGAEKHCWRGGGPKGAGAVSKSLKEPTQRYHKCCPNFEVALKHTNFIQFCWFQLSKSQIVTAKGETIIEFLVKFQYLSNFFLQSLGR